MRRRTIKPSFAGSVFVKKTDWPGQARCARPEWSALVPEREYRSDRASPGSTEETRTEQSKAGKLTNDMAAKRAEDIAKEEFDDDHHDYRL